MPKRNIIFTASPYPKADIQIGSLIPSRSEPDTDAFAPITVPSSDISCIEDGAFTDLWNTESSAAFIATLSKLFSASVKHNPSTKIEIVAAPDSDGLKSFVYKLKNPGELFKGICKIQTALVWLEQAYRAGEEVWLVVEYRTLVNACVTISDASSSDVRGRGAIPIAELAGMPALGSFADVGAEGNFARRSEKKTAFLAKGERVFAVGCKRVTVRSYRWSQNDPKIDKETCWKSALTRSETHGQAEIPMMEATLDDQEDYENDVDGKGSDVKQSVSLGDESFLILS